MTHGEIVASAGFSPDGKRVVTASWDKTARVWDADTGKPVGEPMTHSDEVNSASFSPDGKRVVTASYDKTARVWDASSGAPIGPALEHDSSVTQGAFSPDSSRVATVSEDGTARVWNAASGALIGVPLQTAGAATHVDWSPDGLRLVIATGVRIESSPSGSTGGSLPQRNAADVPGSAPAVAESAASAHPAQRLRPNAAYVVRAPQTTPQTTPPPYTGQGGADRLRELIGARSEANIGAIVALVVLASALALVGARRQRRQHAALQPPSAA